MGIPLLGRTPEDWKRRIWLAQTVLGWGSSILLLVQYLRQLPYCGIDLAYDYVAARALLEGVDFSSTSVADLALHYLPDKMGSLSFYQYPNAHPPALVLATVPFALLPFSMASTVWLIMNVLLMLLVGGWLGFSRRASMALLAWPPLFLLLTSGNYELLILFLVVAAWRAADVGRDRRAGLYIGLAAVMKFYPGLFIIPFLVRRRFKLVVSTCAVFLLGQVLGAIIVGGITGLVGYYQRLASIETSVILPGWINSSPYAALLRLLSGVGGIPPLVSAPGLVLPITMGLSVVGVVALVRLRPEAAPVAALVALPNNAFYCAVLALPQLAILWRLRDRPFGIWRKVLVGIAVAMSVVVALVNLAVIPVSLAVGLGAEYTLTVAVVFLAAMPLGFIALLAVSFVAEMRRSLAAPGEVTLSGREDAVRAGESSES